MHNKWNVTGIGKTATSVVPSEEPQVVNGKLLNKILTQQKEVTKLSDFVRVRISLVMSKYCTAKSGFQK